MILEQDSSPAEYGSSQAGSDEGLGVIVCAFFCSDSICLLQSSSSSNRHTGEGISSIHTPRNRVMLRDH